ncbi:hypothetical protein [Niallia sp. Krafla_26]|uniref:hypothetical protein n=1 Tax=Niallia sp. Krafla_26 TaxID=3064703 RepID=UPI003D173A71
MTDYNYCSRCKSNPIDIDLNLDNENRIENNPGNTNTFNPVITVSPCCCPNNQQPPIPVPQSAFRAIKNNTSQSIENNLELVTFEIEEFDLNNEYIPGNLSAFVPQQDGVYLIRASIAYTTNDPTADNLAALVIVLNGDPTGAGNILEVKNDYMLEGIQNITTITSIIQLQAGKPVQIYAASREPGSISSGLLANFEAARLATLSTIGNSPIINSLSRQSNLTLEELQKSIF